MFALENVVTAIVFIFIIGSTVITVGILLKILKSENKEGKSSNFVENSDLNKQDDCNLKEKKEEQEEIEEIDYNAGLLN